MPLPTGRQVHVDVPLTNISIAFTVKNGNNPFGYVADKVFPIVPVSKKSDLYYKYNKGDWFRGGSRKRGPSTQSAGIGYNVTTDSYQCEVFALHDDISDQDLANVDPQIDLESDATELLGQAFMIDREVAWADTYFKANVWDVDKTGGTDFARWDDYVNSDPANDIELLKAGMEQKTGFSPNKLVVGRRVHSRLKRHPLLRDQFKYTSSDSITPAMIARVFEVDQYMVCGGVRNSGPEVPGADSKAADVFDFIQGNHVWFGYAAPSARLRAPSAGYTMSWTGYLGGAYAAAQIESFYMKEIKATRVEGEMAYVHKVVCPELGAFLGNAVLA